jgi:HAD superfamily hydrolase (TIGR01549 family)
LDIYPEEIKMTTKQTLQAIFFDFDGVIVDSNPTKTEAFRTLFSNYNEKIVEEIVAYHQQHGGISRVEKIRYAHQHIIKQPLTDEELASWAAEYSKLVMENVIDARWIKGAKEFLTERQGSLPIFVISGTPEPELREIIERRKMIGYFREILGSPVKKPPHIHRLLSDYQFVAKDCVFVGDALTDFNAARETGLRFIGIRGEVTFPDGTTVLPDCRGLEQAISEYFVW